MTFDYKKEYKEFYMPPKQPSIVKIPPMNFIAIQGQGDPNAENGEYKLGVGALYAVAYTLKMSYKTDHQIEGYFAYVVPPLEGFWWQNDTQGMDYTRKQDLHFLSVIRLPDFITPDEVEWAKSEAARKKKMDTSNVKFMCIEEGLCVQCMHVGAYDDEPATVDLMHVYVKEQGYKLDFSENRLHHEIYLGDPRKTRPDKLKTVIRHPITIITR